VSASTTTTFARNRVSAARVELLAHSASLRKELRLFDLFLAQILLVIIPDYLSTSVKAGSAQVFYWVLGIVFFFVPLAMVVIHMSRLLPLEGGMYEWARIAFNDRLGFLVAWNIWVYAILYVAIAGLITVSFASYAIPGAAWIVSSKPIRLAASLAIIGATMIVAGLGLRVGKWIGNIGTLAFLLTILLLIVSPFLSVWRGTLPEYHPFTFVVPPLNLFGLSIFSKMTFGALVGFEYVAALAGECRNPRRDLPRSVLLTAPAIALIYILATSAIQAFVPASSEDVVAPVAQALSRGGAQAFGAPGVIVPGAIAALFAYYLATFCILFGICTRLPMVAGWDHLLPEWFSRLHPLRKTPVNSIFILGVATLLFGTVASIGVTPEEAFQLLLTCSFTFYALAYLALFAIPLFSPKERGLRPGLWTRLAAGSGLLVTLLFIVLAVVPIIDVQSSWHYSIKIAAVVICANFIAVAVYGLRGQKTSPSPAVAHQQIQD
jgi:glutamate:GABA antiporter